MPQTPSPPHTRHHPLAHRCTPEYWRNATHCDTCGTPYTTIADCQACSKERSHIDADNLPHSTAPECAACNRARAEGKDICDMLTWQQAAERARHATAYASLCEHHQQHQNDLPASIQHNRYHIKKQL